MYISSPSYYFCPAGFLFQILAHQRVTLSRVSRGPIIIWWANIQNRAKCCIRTTLFFYGFTNLSLCFLLGFPSSRFPLTGGLASFQKWSVQPQIKLGPLQRAAEILVFVIWSYTECGQMDVRWECIRAWSTKTHLFREGPSALCLGPSWGVVSKLVSNQYQYQYHISVG